MRSVFPTLIALLALTVPAWSQDVTPAQQQSYQVSYLLQMTIVRQASFAKAVTTLRDVNDDIVGAKRVKELSELATALREDEAQSYTKAHDILYAMSAPPTILTWVDGASKTLNAPLVLSKEAKPYAKKEPQVAQILATMDEASALKFQMDQYNPSLTTWLKLTRGYDAVWSRDLGAAVAVIHDALAHHNADDYPISTLKQLAASAPASTSKSVTETLAVLTKPQPVVDGAKTPSVKADVLWEAEVALNKIYTSAPSDKS